MISRTRRTVTAVALVSVAGLLASFTAGVSYASPARFHPARPQLGTAIPVTRHATTAARRTLAAMPLAHAGHALTPGTHVLSLGSPTIVQRAGALGATGAQSWQQATAGLSVAATTASTRKTKPVTVAVTVLTAAESKVAGYAGPVLKVSRADGNASLTTVAVRIDSSVLRAAFGADYAARVRWQQLATSSTGTTTSRARPLPAVVTPESTTLRPIVGKAAVLLAPAGSPVSATGTGSFAATPLKQSDSWQVSAQTGDFSWNYPMRIPPSPAGPSPELALQYDSQSVDGETGSTNNQPSAIGDGWSLAAGGSIDRSYTACATSDGPSAAIPNSGDLCWSTANATVSFGGHSGALVRDSAGTWKIQGDDSTRVEQLTGTTNGTYDGDYWRLTTTDGSQYYFGLNRLPGWSASNPVTNSAWTVPVCGTATVNCTGTATTAGPFNAQAWRWNLDYVVDPHGNAESYTYAADTNQYAEHGSGAISYVRGGELTEIDYGLRSANLFATTAASAKVVFAYAARCDLSQGEPAADCNPATPVASYWPDVPWDQDCASASCSQTSPTFWSKLMLSTVTTEVLSGGTYPRVDVWTLGHSWPDPGDSTSAALWLTQVAHVGYSGSASITAPTTKFNGVKMQNRVWVIDGLAPLVKWRINEIDSGSGDVTTIAYSAQQCTPAMVPALASSPQTNTNRCYPAWWTPQTTPAQPAQLDFFHKYLVTQVDDDPSTGGAGYYQRHESDYYYTGTPAWRFDETPGTNDGQRTWSVWAGYNTVEVRTGDPGNAATQRTTDYTFFQGLDGDPNGNIHTPTASSRTVLLSAGGNSVHDSLWWAGRVLEQVTRLGSSGGTVPSTTTALSDMVTVPWASAATATTSRTYTYTDPADSSTYSATLSTSAYQTGEGTVTTTSPTSTGTRTDTVSHSYDSYGRVVQVQDAASDADTTCTRTAYATNTSAWLIDYPSTVSEVGVACAATPTYPGDAVTATATSYDGQTLGTAPSVGDVTTTQVASAYTAGGTPTWQSTQTASYDALGRVSLTSDPRTTPASSTATVYTPAAGGPLTQTDVTTNPQTWKTTTTFLPAWGVVASVTDQNLNLTTATYDALGRRSQVWLPNRPQASNPTSPSTSYAYTLSATAPNTIATTAINASGGTSTSYALFDGLGQQRQSQAPAEGGGTDVIDTTTDASGQTTLQSAVYYVTGSPSATLATHSVTLPSQTQTSYDGAGRVTATTLLNGSTAVWSSTHSYLGTDRVDSNPATGGTPTSTYTNLRGQTTSLVQYLATSVNGTATTETTNYSYDPRGDMIKMKDNPGNIWQWAFDVLGEQTSATDPDSGTTIKTFYPDGDLETSTDAAGNKLTYTYDSLRRKTGEYSGVDTSGVELAAWAYDTATSGKGSVAAATRYVGGTAGSPGSGTAYQNNVASYNSLGSPTSASVVIGGTTPIAGTYTTAFSYAADGTLSSRTDPAEGGLPSEKITYGFDSLGNVSGAGSPAGSVVTSITYSHLGQLGQIFQSQGAQVYRTYTWDTTTLRLNELLTQRNATANAVVSDDSYTYDQAGNVKEDNNVTAAAGTDTQCYNYDYLRNLTNAWTPANNSCTTAPSTSMAFGGPAPYWTNYSVDPGTGNRTGSTAHTLSSGAVTASTSSSYHYNAATATQPHAVQSVTNTTGGSTTTDNYSYNADGNATALPGQTVSYDTEGRPTASTITSTAKSQTNIYDADGTLLLQTDPVTGTTGYLGDTQLHVAAGSTTSTASRTYTVAGQPIAERDTTAGVTGNKYYFLDDDLHNTATAQVAAATAVVTRRYLDPYGNTRGTPTAWISNHQFLDAAQNPLTTTSTTTPTLSLLGAREYDPVIGKFLTLDPILDPTNPSQNNGYSYAANNPTTNSDPSGLRFACDSGSCDQSGADHAPPPTASGSCVTRACNHDPVAGGGVNSTAGGYPSSMTSITPHVSVRADDSGGAALAAAYADWAGGTKHAGGSGYTNSVLSALSNPGGEATAEATAWFLFCKQSSLCGKALYFEFRGLWQSTAMSGPSNIGLKDLTVTCGGNSFTPDTDVLMADKALKPISKIGVGEQVEATNLQTGKRESKTVTAVWINDDHDLLNLTVQAGGQLQVIHSTQHHLFYDPALRTWVEAAALRAGERLQAADGSLIIVRSTTTVRGHAYMWDLTVDADHDFYVATFSAGVLVHNCGSGLVFVRNTAGRLIDPATGQYVSDPETVRAEPGDPTHGNSLSSPKTAYLYRLEDQDGNLLKNGITSDPQTRYTQTFMADKEMDVINSGSRASMVQLERQMTEIDPGPLNFEPWAGAGLTAAEAGEP